MKCVKIVIIISLLFTMPYASLHAKVTRKSSAKSTTKSRGHQPRRTTPVASGVKTTTLASTIARVTPSIVVVSSRTDSGASKIATGFAVKAQGYLLTAWHAVDLGNVVVGVKSGSGYKSYQAAVIASDPNHDMALLKIDANLTPLSLDDAGHTAGEMTAVTGYPLGLAIDNHLVPCTSSGIISAIRLPASNEEGTELLQLDMLLEPGNSGAPVYMPSTGKVIGMVSSQIVPANSESSRFRIGFALDSRLLLRFIRQHL